MTCSVPGCDGVVRARGWCNKHYQRWCIHGNPLTDMRTGVNARNRKKLRVRFRVTGCIEVVSHSGGVNHYPKAGKGRYGDRSSPWFHVVWEQAKGTRPKGHEIHHTCENKLCINIEHLELMTTGEHRSMHMKNVWERARL